MRLIERAPRPDRWTFPTRRPLFCSSVTRASSWSLVRLLQLDMAQALRNQFQAVCIASAAALPQVPAAVQPGRYGLCHCDLGGLHQDAMGAVRLYLIQSGPGLAELVVRVTALVPRAIRLPAHVHDEPVPDLTGLRDDPVHLASERKMSSDRTTSWETRSSGPGAKPILTCMPLRSRG